MIIVSPTWVYLELWNQHVSWYFIPGKTYWLRDVEAKTRIFFVMSLCLITALSKFHVLINIIFFLIWSITKLFFKSIENQLNIYIFMGITWSWITWQFGERKKKLWSLTVDHFGYIEDFISIFFIFFNLQWNTIYFYLPGRKSPEAPSTHQAPHPAMPECLKSSVYQLQFFSLCYTGVFWPHFSHHSYLVLNTLSMEPAGKTYRWWKLNIKCGWQNMLSNKFRSAPKRL